ncbi:MAG: outer membrane beta-barrel protein [Candidatus Angelobacter sp.]
MSRFGLTLRAVTFALALLGLVTLGAGAAYGQSVSGNIVGTVTDSSGAAVVNADVSVTNVNTGIGANTKSSNTGGYRFDNLPAGFYRVSAKSSGFRTTTMQIEVLLNQTGTANITLSPGAASETVEVSGAAPIIDTTTTQLQTTFEQRLLQDLPTSNFGLSSSGQNLGVLNLSLLGAGVGSSGGTGAGTGPSISGQRPRNNNFTIEGVDNNDKGITGPLIYTPADAVENFSILQNQFAPEFGHSTGGQFNIVVTSGTNTFHGKAYEYFQNRNLNAIDQAVVNSTPSGQTPTNPRYDNNRFGGQIGGPIFKNKLFFFVNYERNPLGQATVLSQAVLAPTAAGYAALAAIPGVSAANITALKQYANAPAPCTAADVSGGICPGLTVPVNTTPVEIGVIPIIAPNWQNLNALTTSMDYNISERDQIRGRYIYNSHTFVDNLANLPIFYTTNKQPYHLINISEYHTFSPTITNELRVGYNRTGYNYVVPNLTFAPQFGTDFPNVQIDQLNNLNVGPDPNAPQYSVQNLYQAVDNLTWIKKAHTLKFGIEGRKYISPQLFIQRSRGDYEYDTLENYANDLSPVFAERSFGSAGYSGDQYGIFWYVNDIWKVRSNLSLNLGLRYEYTSTPYGWTQQSLNSVADVPGLITFGSPKAPKKDFMPRIGFAYTPGSSGNTSIRGGFGMGYDVLYDNIGTLSRPPQIGQTTDCPDSTNPICDTPFLAHAGIPPQASSGITVLSPADARAATASYLPNNVQYPYSESWNLGVQRVFKRNYTAEVRYVGTRGVQLNVQNRLNVIAKVTPSQFLPTYMTPPSQATLDALPLTLDALNALPSKDPNYTNAGFKSNIVGFMPWGASTYHGLQTQLNHRFADGLQFVAAYTYSHSIDNSTADVFSTILAPRRPQDFRNLPGERGNSLLDHRHRFTVSAVYELPFNKTSSSWVRRNLLGNYQLAPVYTYETGQWGTPQSGLDSNLNGDNAGDRVILNPGGISGKGANAAPLTNTAGDVVAYCASSDGTTCDSPNAQYVVAGPGALANSGRSILKTSNINNWDLSLAKNINITERYKVQLIMGAFNIFNHAQFTTGSVNQATGISDTTQRDYLIPSASTFNNPRVTWASNARQLMLGAKFVF